MNKKLVLVICSVGAALTWWWQSAIPLEPVAAQTNAIATSAAAPTTAVPVKPYAAMVQDIDPYGRCSAKTSSVLHDEEALVQLLLPLLADGKTPAEMLHFNVTAAVSPRRYAQSIGNAMHQIGLQQLNLQPPSILSLLSQRLGPDLKDQPIALAARMAELEEFQNFVPLGKGTWGGSMLMSPSLILMHLSPQIPIADFRQMIAGKSFLPLEIAVAMQARASDEHLLALIAQGRDINQFPAGYEFTNSIAPMWNLADVAAALFQPAALQALKQLGVTPTNMEGVVTGLDFALFSNHRLLREPDQDPAVEQAYQQALQHAQQQTVNYLVAEGYWAHGLQSDSGDWFFGNHYFMTNSVKTERILALLPKGKFETLVRNPGFLRQPIPDDTALAAWVTKIATATADENAAYTQCQQQKQQQLTADNLLHQDDIREQIYQWRGEQTAADTPIAPMHAQDPAWVAWHWQMGGALELPTNEKLQEQLQALLHNPAALQDFLQKTALDSATTAWLLMEMHRNPALLPLFNQRYNPVAPDYLYPVFWHADAADLAALTQDGYDFTMQDRHGRNLYHTAFLQSPDAVLFLLAQNVAPLSQQLGPDALDLALEFSYRHQQLHPALPMILEQVSDFEPSHLARLKRLQQYRPELFAQVLTLKPKLQLPADVTPNALLTPLTR